MMGDCARKEVFGRGRSYLVFLYEPSKTSSRHAQIHGKGASESIVARHAKMCARTVVAGCRNAACEEGKGDNRNAKLCRVCEGNDEETSAKCWARIAACFPPANRRSSGRTTRGGPTLSRQAAGRAYLLHFDLTSTSLPLSLSHLKAAKVTPVNARLLHRSIALER